MFKLALIVAIAGLAVLGLILLVAGSLALAAAMLFVVVMGGLLAIWALGSLLSGLVTGALRLKASNATRFRWGMVALGLLMLPLLAVIAVMFL